MVVKSATKKKLMDLGVYEYHAHLLADDRKWDDVKKLSILDIGTIIFGDMDVASANADDWLSKGEKIFYLIHPYRRPIPNPPPTRKKLGILNWWWGEGNESSLLDRGVEDIFYTLLTDSVGRASIDVDDDVEPPNDSSMDLWFRENIREDTILFYMENRFSSLAEERHFVKRKEGINDHVRHKKLHDSIAEKIGNDGWSESIYSLLALIILEWDSLDLSKPFMLIPSEEVMKWLVNSFVEGLNKGVEGWEAKIKYEMFSTEQPIGDFINPEVIKPENYETPSYKVVGIRTTDGKKKQNLLVSFNNLSSEGYYCVSPLMNAWAAHYCSQRWPDLWKQFLHLEG